MPCWFSQHGYRFVEVSGWGGAFTGGEGLTNALEATLESSGGSSLSLTSYLVHTNVAEISTTRFDSFDPKQENIINRIKHITLYAQKSNYHSIPTDCPTVRASCFARSSVGTSICLSCPCTEQATGLFRSESDEAGWA